MAFLGRNHLWPLFPSGADKSIRMRWVLWRWWFWPIERRYRQWRCQEHEPISVRVGLMQEFIDGSEGRQRVICGRCMLTLRDFQ